MGLFDSQSQKLERNLKEIVHCEGDIAFIKGAKGFSKVYRTYARYSYHAVELVILDNCIEPLLSIKSFVK